jgi:hypothetical protein
MTQVVIGDILPYTQATAILNQTIFGTNWTANYASDVVVYQTPSGDAPDDATQILAYPADYSVAFIGDQLQVQVTLVTGAGAGDIVTITRMTPADRENLYTNTNFVPTMLNNDFGILTLVDQQAQLVNQLIGPRYNYSAKITDVVDTILPILGANQIWAKNQNNTAIIAITAGAAGSGNILPGLTNQLAWYNMDGTTLVGLPTANNSVLVTSNSGAPSLSRTLPSGISATDMVLTTPTIDEVLDSSGNILLKFSPQPSAINYITVTNEAINTGPYIYSAGADSQVALNFGNKNRSFNFFDITNTIGANLSLFNAAATHYVALQVPTSFSGNYIITLPTVDGVAGDVLTTNGSGVWSFQPAGGGGNISSWQTITAASIAVVSGNGIVANRSSTQVQVELPATFAVGDAIAVLGSGSGGWSVVANTGQTIQFGSVATMSAGSISSDIQYANIYLRGLVANTTWTVESVNSNPTYM